MQSYRFIYYLLFSGVLVAVAFVICFSLLIRDFGNALVTLVTLLVSKQSSNKHCGLDRNSSEAIVSEEECKISESAVVLTFFSPTASCAVSLSWDTRHSQYIPTTVRYRTCWYCTIVLSSWAASLAQVS